LKHKHDQVTASLDELRIHGGSCGGRRGGVRLGRKKKLATWMDNADAICADLHVSCGTYNEERT